MASAQGPGDPGLRALPGVRGPGRHPVCAGGAHCRQGQLCATGRPGIRSYHLARATAALLIVDEVGYLPIGRRQPVLPPAWLQGLGPATTWSPDHYIKARVKVCRHTDGTLSVFHGPRRRLKVFCSLYTDRGSHP